MAIEVRIPTILRTYTDGAKAVEGSGDTLAELFADLETRHTGIQEPHRRRRPAAPLRERLPERRGRPLPRRHLHQARRRRQRHDPPGRRRRHGAAAMRYDSPLAAVGNTPLVRLPRLSPLRRRPHLGQAGGPQPDRLGQGPPRAPHDRAGGEGRPPDARLHDPGADVAATPASRWRWRPSSRATASSASCRRTPARSAASCSRCGARRSSRRPPRAAPTRPCGSPRSSPPSTRPG